MQAYTIQIGDVVLAAGGEPVDYRVREVRFPAPAERADIAAAKDAGGAAVESEEHDPAERVIVFDALGTDERTTASRVNAVLVAARRRGAKLLFRASATSELLECEIRTAAASEDTYDPLGRSRGRIRVTLVLTTSPYWVGEEITLEPVSITNVPGTVPVTGVPGEVPALTRILSTFGQAVTGIWIGLRSRPSAAFAPVRDLAGTADAITVNGTLTSAAIPTNTATEVSATPSLDTAAHMGSYLILARLRHTATTAAAMVYRAISRITASGMTGTASDRSEAATAATVTGANYEIARLGVLALPAGAVPSLATGSGFGAEVVSANATGATLIDLEGGVFRITTEQSGIHRGARFRIRNAAGFGIALRALLHHASGGLPVGSPLATAEVTVANGFDGHVRFNWAHEIASGSYAVFVRSNVGASFPGLQVYANTAPAVNAGGMWSGVGPETVLCDGLLGAEVSLAGGATGASSAKGSAFGQNFTLASRAVIIRARVWYTDNSDTSWSQITARIESSSGTVLQSREVFYSPPRDGWIDINFPDAILPPASGYRLRCWGTAESDYFFSPTSTYAGGTRLDGAGSALSGDILFDIFGRVISNVDFDFQSYMSLPLGFGSAFAIEATCSEASRTVSTDWITAIPVDEGAVMVLSSFGAGEGILVDNIASRPGDRNIYAANAGGGRGLSRIGSTTPYGSLMLRPADNVLVVAAATPTNAVPASATVMVSYRPRYLTAASGR